MRKITQDAVNALRSGENFARSNTAVNAETATMMLHGNAVAGYKNGSFWFDLCGWNTLTTRERISGALPKGTISTKSGVVSYHYEGKSVEVEQSGKQYLSDLLEKLQ